MTLIWGLKRARRRKPQEDPAATLDLQRRSRILLQTLDQQKAKIFVPTVAVAELLTGIRSEDHGRFIAELQKRFFCPPLDLRASALAAQIWQKYRSLPSRDPLQRDVLKADVLIIAIAKAAGATVFYSHDKNCQKLAVLATMTARDLPTHSEDMFIDLESRQEDSPKD